MDNCARHNEVRTEIIDKVANVLQQERATITNIELAVHKAGVRRESVIAAFGSMHGLILEMVSDLSGALIQPLQRHRDHQSLRNVLIEFGNRVTHTYSVSHLVALYRIALNEATRHSGIGREFCERGPGKLTSSLAQYLEFSSACSKQFRIDNPKHLADAFLSLLGDHLELFYAGTATKSSCSKDQSDAITEAVELFCRGIVAEGQ